MVPKLTRCTPLNGKAGVSVGNRHPVTGSHIEEAYAESEIGLGWRLLASPVDVLNSVEGVFVGLNPGSRVDPHDHPGGATPSESAYVSAQ